MKKSINYCLSVFFATLFFVACNDDKREEKSTDAAVAFPELKIADNPHYFKTSDSKPFFWLGDTGWLLFNKLDRSEIDTYLSNRKDKGFNVIQVMVLHSLEAVNVYGDTALVAKNVSKPIVTNGSDFNDNLAYDFWDHVDYAVDLAQEKGLYMALVPIWGSNVNDGKVTKEEAAEYAKFLAERYKSRPNVIWLNGGDTFGNEYTEVWDTLGSVLKSNNPDKLITFHPRGRMQSSDWFQESPWMDFNMIQSGHRRYDQDDTERGYGQDNWKYIQTDYNLKPTKPVVDGEPSYEGIPQGLHDTLQPFWKAEDVRRYGYWSVFAGAAGYTYGHSAIMQFHDQKDSVGAYGNKLLWPVAMEAPGATQMKYIKDLMLKFPFESRIPDSSLVANQGEKYQYIAATRGENYALLYAYDAEVIKVNMGKISGDKVKASWFDPRTGTISNIGSFDNKGIQEFNPKRMNDSEGYYKDWVLILESE